MLILTPLQVLVRGFRLISGLPNLPDATTYKKKHTTRFCQHFGSNPIVIACIWSDVQAQGLVGEKYKNEKGFRKLLTAVHFLWAYPKNADILATATGKGCKRQVEGENLWLWVRMIAALRFSTFVWPEEEFASRTGQIFIVSVDGVDFKCWEKKHPLMPYDKGQYSHKFKHGGLKYEIAIDVYRAKVVWINGPFRGGEHDKVIYTKGLQEKIPQGKKIIADRVYGGKAQPDDNIKLALPNACDDKQLANFKSRVRARHESFNGRLKMFKCLSDTYRHNSDKHKYVFFAVAVMVQYQMDNGSPMFDA